MVGTVIAVCDACVLYPAPLRDFLMHLALADLFQAKWSNAIHDEWTRNLLKNRPDITAKQLQRTRDLMDRHIRDCVVTGFERLIPSLILPDADDRHVLAAAIHSRADVIVTYNTKDFPPRALAGHGIEAQHPDEFILGLLELSPNRVFLAARRQRERLHNPPMTVDQFLDTLERQALPKTTALLREAAGII
jgi:predicted nucleic acid-binding protein